MMKKIASLKIILSLLYCLTVTTATDAQISNLLFNSTVSITTMNFDTPSPTISYSGISSGAEGEAIAHAEDSNGNILFFVIGNAVYQANGVLMPGSVGLSASTSSTEINICLVPGETDKYYIIYQESQLCDPLYYSIVDMALDGGMGDVTDLNVLFDANEHSEGMEIVRIPGTNEYWYLSYRCSTGVERYKIDASGIGPAVEILAVGSPGFNYFGVGELDYHNGKIIFGFNGETQSIIADFDPITGLASNMVTIDGIGAYGAEFSEDATKAYLSDWFGNFAQYDLLTSTLTMYDIDNCGANALGQIELGGDGNLYLVHFMGPCVTRIENANTTSPDFIEVPLDEALTLGISDHIQSDVLITIELDALIENVDCFEESTGSISVSITHGEEPFEIEWDHDPGNENTDLSNLPAGNYTIHVSDANDNTVSETYTISQSDPLLVSADIIQPLCFGEPGRVLLEVSGGSIPYTYNWNGLDPDNIPAGTYTVSITDANECVVEIEYTIIELNALEIHFNKIDAQCYGGFGSATLEVLGGSPPYSIDWFGVDKDNIAAGDYLFTVVDANDCTINGNYSIDQPEALDIDVEFEQLDCNYYNGSATTYTYGGVPPYEVNWFGYDTDNLRPGNYFVEITDANGCAYKESFTYHTTGVKVYAPSAFTPNLDGLNETFLPVINCASSFEINIYDRWGKKIFTSTDPNKGWDGNFKGQKLQQGVYYYSLKVVDSDFKLSDHSGHVSLIR